MKRNPRLYLTDILESIQTIEHYTQGVTQERFETDKLLQAGMLHWLQIIGEASTKLPSELKKQHPEIPWRDVAGFRHIVVHDYFAIQLPRVWKVVTEDLLPLKETVQQMLAELPPE